MKGAIYVRNSENSKLGKMDAIYASIQSTCPSSCALKEKGCYAQLSHTGITSRRLDKEARKLSPVSVARSVARVINESYRGGKVPEGTIVRLNVSGDSRTIQGTRLIAKAVSLWLKRGGRAAYGYTHAWKRVPRNTWKKTSILASIDSIEQAKEAQARNYAPALVVGEHISDKAYLLPNSDVKWIPCPNQTRGITCEKCGLCFDSKRLFEGGFGIAFSAHGVMKNSIKRHLKVI